MALGHFIAGLSHPTKKSVRPFINILSSRSQDFQQSHHCQRVLLAVSEQCVPEPLSLLASRLGVYHLFPGKAGVIALGNLHPVVRHVGHKGGQDALQGIRASECQVLDMGAHDRQRVPQSALDVFDSIFVLR